MKRFVQGGSIGYIPSLSINNVATIDQKCEKKITTALSDKDENLVWADVMLTAESS